MLLSLVGDECLLCTVCFCRAARQCAERGNFSLPTRPRRRRDSAQGYRRPVLCRLNWLWTDLRVLTNVWRLCPSLFCSSYYYWISSWFAATFTLPFSPRYFSFSCLREIRCIWNVRQRYNRQLPLLETSVNGFQQHLRAAVSAACDRGCCCATSGLCCLFLACLLPRQQEG